MKVLGCWCWFWSCANIKGWFCCCCGTIAFCWNCCLSRWRLMKSCTYFCNSNNRVLLSLTVRSLRICKAMLTIAWSTSLSFCTSAWLVLDSVSSHWTMRFSNSLFLFLQYFVSGFGLSANSRTGLAMTTTSSSPDGFFAFLLLTFPLVLFLWNIPFCTHWKNVTKNTFHIYC